MSSMKKLIGPNGATFEVKDTAGVASIELDGVALAEPGVDLSSLTATAAEINAVCDANTATAAEITLVADADVNTETVAAAGAVSVTKRITKLAVASGGAVTLAAPDATMLGLVKIIEMTTDDGDVTMATTNIDGSGITTLATWSAVGEALVLVAGTAKWHLVHATAVLS